MVCAFAVKTTDAKYLIKLEQRLNTLDIFGIDLNVIFGIDLNGLQFNLFKKKKK